MTRVLIALDSFKGSIGSLAAGAAVARGFQTALPEWEVEVVAVADGGEGTLDALGPEARTVTTYAADLNNGPRRARYAMLGSTAIIESAEVLGLSLATAPPLGRTSRGVGDLLLHAVETQGAKSVVVGCGGTGSMDAGWGMLCELAGKPDGPDLAGGVGELIEIARRRLACIDLVGAVDVDNVLSGIDGAVVYCPQKGLPITPELIATFDRVGRVYDAALASLGLPGVSDRQGAGAAGGLGAALAMVGGRLEAGFETLSSWTGFDAALAGADYVVTGEGRLDLTSFTGKLVSRVLVHADHRPCVLVVGQADADGKVEARRRGAAAVFTLAATADAASAAIAEPAPLLAEAGRRVAAFLSERTGDS